MKKPIFFIAGCLVLGGCETIGNWADNAGSYMPVLSDERCEHWQCFTEEGKAISRANQQYRQQQDQREQGQEYYQEKMEVGEQDPAMRQQYEHYYREQVQAGQTPVSYEQYVQYMQQFKQQEQQQQNQQQPQAQQPSGYRPLPEMNPYDNYKP